MLKKNVLRPGLDWVYKVLFVVQSVCMYASVLTIVVTVLMRELFRVSIVWGYEIACWFVIILVFTSMPANLYKKSNIGVTFVYDISPKVVKRILSVVHFIVEASCIVMMASGFKIWITKVGMGTMVASGFTNVAYYGVIGIGVALSAIELIAEIIDVFVKKEAPQEIEEEKSLMEELAEDVEGKVDN